MLTLKWTQIYEDNKLVFQSKIYYLETMETDLLFLCFLPRCVWDKFINRKAVRQNYGFEFIIAVGLQIGYKLLPSLESKPT
jgi:hypothetical protein